MGNPRHLGNDSPCGQTQVEFPSCFHMGTLDCSEHLSNIVAPSIGVATKAARFLFE